MVKYFAKRTCFALVSLFVVITAVFLLMRLLPVEGYFGNRSDVMDETTKNNVLKTLGLLDPWYVQLGHFYQDIAQGDFGRSITLRPKAKVARILSEKIPYSLSFGLASIIFSLAAGCGLGILMARSKGKFWDKIGTGYIVIINAVPPIIYYLMVQLGVTSVLALPILRFLYERQSEAEKNDVINASALPFILQCVFMAGAAWLYGYMAHLNYVVWMMLFGITQGATTYLGFIARGLNRNVDFALSGVICSVINLALNVVLIAVFGWGYRALYVGYVVGAMVQLLYLAFRIGLFRRLKWRAMLANSHLTKELLRFSLPLCFNTVAYWFLASASKILYNLIWGDSASGIFAIGQKFGTLITLVTTCFTFAWQDVSFSRANDPDRLGEFYSNGCDTYLRFLMTGMAVMLPVLRLIFPWFVKGDYTGAVVYIPLFILNALISGYSAFVGNLFYAIKDTKTIAISTIVSAVVNLILAYPMIKGWGMYGANISCILAFCLNIGIRAYILRRKIGFKLYWSTLLKYAVWIAASAFVYNFNHTAVLIPFFLISLGLCYLLNRSFIMNLVKRGGKTQTNVMQQ